MKFMQELQEYKLNLARRAIKSKDENGTTYQHFAKEQGIPYSTLMDWVRYAKANPVQAEVNN